jgi:alkylation response protein AidB-like acyl-CoA dehydrogenase
MNNFTESDERLALRKAVADLGAKYGRDYFEKAAKEGRKTTELWEEAGKLGYLGVAVPEEFGGGGGDIGDLAAVCEELAAAGSPLLLMVVSPAIVGTIIAQYGTQAQKERWLPGLADGTSTFAFSITEPDAGSNSHQIITTAYREDDGWRLKGTKTSRAPRTPAPATSSPRCSSCRPTSTGSPTSRSTWASRRPRSSSRCSSTTYACPPTP